MCGARKQARFGLGRNAHEPIMHICTKERGHGGRHLDGHTGHSW